MSDNPTPNQPPLSEEQRRIKELEAEVARLQKALDQANEMKDIYWRTLLASEDWTQVDRDLKEAMEGPKYTLGELIEELDRKGDSDAA